MGIIKWLNSHAIPATIFYFALMGGIAWGVNQSIADRTALEAMPADGDLIAIYDLDATAGKSIAVSTFRGDNLNAIVNAATGVTDPTITMYDNDTAAGTAKIYGTSTGSYDVVMSIGVEDSGSATGTTYIELNGTQEKAIIKKPMSYRRNIIDVDLDDGDVDAAAGGIQDCYGGIFEVYDGDGNTNDLTLTGCNCDEVTVAADGPFLWVYQRQTSEDISIYPGPDEAFRFMDARKLDDGDELESPATAFSRGNWVFLSCENTGDNWNVIEVQGIMADGTVAPDHNLHGLTTSDGYWFDGGTAD